MFNKKIPTPVYAILLVALVAAIAFKVWSDLSPDQPNPETTKNAEALCQSVAAEWGYTYQGRSVSKGIASEDFGITTDVVVCHFDEGDYAQIFLYVDGEFYDIIP